nr:putative RNA-directed DNA polymerase, eukaryota, reverse transcriptase zinc-binding domain protein [Tanacetum cinerariifolium]
MHFGVVVETKRLARRVRTDKTYISHLQFVDDALIMSEWSLTNAKNSSRILTYFHLASGLKVNFNKSKLFGVGVTLLEVNSIALSIGCQPSQFPCIYLGLHIGANMSRCANWSPIIDHFLKRLSRWKSKTLSFGGHLTLIKSVLNGLGVYYFSTFKAPKKIIDKLESITRNFFWGGSLVTTIFLIPWDKALSPINQRGLGICSLKVNIGKYCVCDVSNEEIKRAVWDYSIDKSPGPDGFTFDFYRRFWNLIENDVYDAVKYFFTYGVIPKGCNSYFIALILKIPDANTVKDFKPISLIGSLNKIVAKILANCLVGVLGDIVNVVQSAFIAEMQILDDRSFLMKYYNGVLVDSDKVECAASKLGCLILKTPFSYLGSKVGGSISRVHTWNEVVDRVKNRLSKWKMKTLLIGGRQMDMGFESSGDFSVASVRKVIDDKSLSEVDSKTRWIKYAPIKVNVHASKVKTDSLPTRFNVSRRGIHIDSIMCAICDKGAETSSHLFFSCCMARQTVRMITRWWDVPYGEVDSYEDWIN